MAGDSIARSLYAALLRIFDDDESSGTRRVAYGHQSFEYTLPGAIRASFVWAPYTANVTDQINAWCATTTGICPCRVSSKGSQRDCLMWWLRRHDTDVMPDVLVVGTALWHVLHVHNADAFENQLVLLRNLKTSLLPSVPAFFLAPSQVCRLRAQYLWRSHIEQATRS